VIAISNPEYRWTGRVQDEHVLRVDQLIEVAPGTEVEMVVSPKTSRPDDQEHDLRLNVWKEFLAMPVSEEDKRFWVELEEQATRTRHDGRLAAAGVDVRMETIPASSYCAHSTV